MKTYQVIRLLPIAAALVMLAACRGGVNLTSIPTTITPGTFSTQTPIVIFTNPVNNVAPDRLLYMKFNHDMDPATLNANTVFISGVTSTVIYDAPNRTVYLKPTKDLAAYTQYVVTATADVRDTAGVAMPAVFKFAFNTRPNLDLSPPTVIPIPGCVPQNGPVAVQFDEDMISMTINSSTFLVFDENGAMVPGTVTYDAATRIATFVPSNVFTEGASYTGTITTGAQDLGGVPLESDFVLTFSICPNPDRPPYCSFSKGGYSGNGRPGQYLINNFASVFFSDLIIGIYDGAGPQGSIRWTADPTGIAALRAFLTSSVTQQDTIPGDFVNPSQNPTSNLSAQTAALALNIGFSGTGFFPTGFDKLVLVNTGTSLDGSSILDILGAANLALAGDGLPDGYTFGQLNDLITNLNESFDNCVESAWATGHLVSP